MSGYILCQVKKAEKPFYIENISTNIYSIEELCYYLYNNLYLVDRSLISNKLCTWLDEELKLPKLAAKLRPFIGKEAGLEEILYPIFKEINYLAYEELRILNGRIERRNKESEEIREKRKGDALMENRMYVNAIRVYQKLLEKDSREISREMRERILHNQGCAYSYLFQMDKALDCFFAAWKVNQSEKALKIYLLAYRSVHTPEEFEKIQEDLKAEDSVKKETARALEQFISLPEQGIHFTLLFCDLICTRESSILLSIGNFSLHISFQFTDFRLMVLFQPCQLPICCFLCSFQCPTSLFLACL